MDIRFDQIKSYCNGKAGLITGLCEQIDVNDVFTMGVRYQNGINL